MKLSDIVDGTGGTQVGLPDCGADVGEIVVDSRKSLPGSVFFALPGERTDGHAFIPDAIRRGASIAVASTAWDGVGALAGQASFVLVDDTLLALQRLGTWWLSRHDVEVIGITGSVGKSSTKEMIAALLSRRFRILKNEGNLNSDIGLPLTLLRLTGEVEKAVLEMGGAWAPGEIRRLTEIAHPHIGVVTNVSHVHLERMGTIERIAETKGELVEALPEDGVAILNGDDPLVRGMAPRAKARVFYYGLGQDCDLWADEVESHGLDGIHFRIHHGSMAAYVHVPLLGRHSVHTALAAVAVGLAEGMEWGEVVGILEDSRVQLRLLVVPGVNGSMLIDDTYNASPLSTIAALDLLQEMPGRKVAVLGDMLELGSYEEEGHRSVGRRAAVVADVLVVRGTRARMMGEEAIRCGMSPDRVWFVEGNEGAAERVRTVVRPGDYVLVKGSRGLRMDEIVERIRP